MATWAATREDVRAALETTGPGDAAQLDRLIEAASDHGEAVARRLLRPHYATRTFPYPDRPRQGATWWLPLHDKGLISLTAATVAGVDVLSSVLLEPHADGPPYDRVELDRTETAFSSGATAQRSVSLTGLWGYTDVQASAGATAEAVDSSEPLIDVTAATAAAVGVGSLLRIDDERMAVTERYYVDTTVNLAGALVDDPADDGVSVTDGTLLAQGELILVDTEWMRVRAIVGNAVTLDRAVEGSTLAAHLNGADVNAVRTLGVDRAAAGSVAAAHDTAEPITVWRPPALYRSAVIAQAVADWTSEGSGGADPEVAGAQGTSGDAADAWARLRRAMGRSARYRSV